MGQNTLEHPAIRNGIIDQKYIVQGYIGGGGMADVYKVRTADDPHPYALKLLKDEYFQDVRLRETFEREAQSLLKLNHPNIVRFFDYAVRAQYAYILMEYVEGYSLSDLLKNLRQSQRVFPDNEVMRVLVQAERAVRYLHQNNLIHRDIKPGNILIERLTGKVFLTDFGIATDLNGSGQHFNAGTRAYMPPEQQEALGIPVQRTADVYALAVVAYEMLAGRRPFLKKNGVSTAEAEQDMIRQHRDTPVPPLSSRRRGLPPELDAIFERALAKQPAGRYPNSRSFILDLHRAMRSYLSPDMQDIDNIAPLDPYKALNRTAGERVNTPPAAGAAAGPAPAVKRRSKAGIVLPLVLALALLAGGTGLILRQQRHSSDPPHTQGASPAAVAAVELPASLPLRDEPATESAVVGFIRPAGNTSTATAAATVSGETPLPAVSPTAALAQEDSPAGLLGAMVQPPETPATTGTPPPVEPSPEGVLPAPPTATPSPIPTGPPAAFPTLTSTPTLSPTPTATETATGTATGTPTHTPTVTLTETPTATPTTTYTPTPTETPTPIPTTYLENEVFLYFVQDAAALGLQGTLADAAATALSESGGFVRLNVGEVGGFRVELGLSGDLRDVIRYGIAYRVQDESNYLLFSVSPGQRSWRIDDVRGGVATPVDGGAFAPDQPVNHLVVMGVGDYFRIELDTALIQHYYTARPAGGLGLWLEMAAGAFPPLATLQVGLAGQEAYRAAEVSPTPAQVVRQEKFLLDDIQTLLAAGDVSTLTIYCPAYMSVFDTLDRHLARPEPMRSLAQRAIDAGALVYTRCQNNPPVNGSLSFVDSMNDFIDWNSSFQTLAAEVQAVLNS